TSRQAARGLWVGRRGHRESRSRIARKRGASRVTRLGVVGHRGYAELPAVLRTLGELAPALGLELQYERELFEVAIGGCLLEDPSRLDALLTLGGDGTLLRGAR